MVFHSALTTNITCIGLLFVVGYKIAIAANMSPEGCLFVASIFAGVSFILLGRLFDFSARIFHKYRQKKN